MAHIRKQIRDLFITQLTGLVTTGGNVFDSPLFALKESIESALLIYGKEESILVDSLGAKGTQQRAYSLMVEAFVRHNSETQIQTTLDLIGSEVEVAILSDVSWALPARLVEMVSASISFDVSGAKAAGSLQMLFNVTYHTKEGIPDTGV